MVMTLSLLVYAVAEETVPDQKGKPTSRPTLRRVFQMFDGLELLEIRMGGEVRRQVLNLTDLHRKLETHATPRNRGNCRVVGEGRERWVVVPLGG